MTLPVTLWFLNRAKVASRRDEILFIDARQIFTQVDRAHRAWSPQQIQFLSGIVQLWRGDRLELGADAARQIEQVFPDGVYSDVAGLCASLRSDELARVGYSLSPPPHVGSAQRVSDVDEEFASRLRAVAEDLELLNADANALTEEVEVRLGRLLAWLEGERDE